MFLKYFNPLPFDRYAIESVHRIDEASSRLAYRTVGRQIYRLGIEDVPGVFEGSVGSDRFTLMTSAERDANYRFTRSRNEFRPVCDGRMQPSANGCRVVVGTRPTLAVVCAQMIRLAVIAGLFAIVFGDRLGHPEWLGLPAVAVAWVVSLATGTDISMGSWTAPLELVAISIVGLVASHVYGLAFFWHMNARARRELTYILT